MVPTYIFCGGGSGGHLYPGIAVADELRKREPNCRIVFVGSMREVESTVLSDTAYEHVSLDMLPGSMLFRSPIRFWRTHRAAVKRSMELLAEYQPAAVIGLGGFASVPVVTAAQKGAVPIVLLEQNRVPGRATSWLSGKADAVCISFPETVVRCNRVELTGNPVREQVVAARESPPGNTVLVLGGSQGAIGLNTLVMSIFDDQSRLPTDWRVVHQTGSKDEQRVRSHYESVGIPADVHAFIDDMPTAYAASGLVICRAGGTTLAELSCVGRASIIVPIPRSVRNHQRLNAECFAESNAAHVFEQSGNVHDAQELVVSLVSTSVRRDQLGRAIKLLGFPDAATKVADVIGETPRACGQSSWRMLDRSSCLEP